MVVETFHASICVFIYIFMLVFVFVVNYTYDSFYCIDSQSYNDVGCLDVVIYEPICYNLNVNQLVILFACLRVGYDYFLKFLVVWLLFKYFILVFFGIINL